MKHRQFKPIFWSKDSYFFLYFGFLSLFCVVLCGALMSCSGRIKPQIATKTFLPQYMRSVYINHFVNKTSEMTLDITIRQILIDHYTELHFKTKKVPFVVKKHHANARLILMTYLNKITRWEQDGKLVADFDVSLKVSKKDQYLLKRKNFVIVIPTHENNVAQALATEIIKILNHFVDTGVFVGKKSY